MEMSETEVSNYLTTLGDQFSMIIDPDNVLEFSIQDAYDAVIHALGYENIWPDKLAAMQPADFVLMAEKMSTWLEHPISAVNVAKAAARVVWHYTPEA